MQSADTSQARIVHGCYAWLIIISGILIIRLSLCNDFRTYPIHTVMWSIMCIMHPQWHMSIITRVEPTTSSHSTYLIHPSPKVMWSIMCIMHPVWYMPIITRVVPITSTTTVIARHTWHPIPCFMLIIPTSILHNKRNLEWFEGALCMVNLVLQRRIPTYSNASKLQDRSSNLSFTSVILIHSNL